jgi:flagellar basal-body rod modification protein FlgD
MDVTGITNAASATQGSTAKGTLGKDDFLKLLTTQLQNQDPLNPLDATAFTAQLAQFSSLESLQDIDSQMKEMVAGQNSMQAAIATGMIGKKVKAGNGDISLKGSAEISYNLSQDAAKVKISILDTAGTLVREAELTKQPSGAGSFVWDGKDSNGKVLPDGMYKCTVQAFDASGNPIAATQSSGGTVTGVSIENNTVYLVLDGGIKVPMSGVTEVSGG